MFFSPVADFVNYLCFLRTRCENVNLCKLLISHRCPAGYSGLSCESCSPGFERVPGPYLGICTGCNCNGHASACDPIGGHCLVRMCFNKYVDYLYTASVDYCTPLTKV